MHLPDAPNWCPTPPTVPPPLNAAFGQVVDVNMSNLCSMGWSPLMITGFLRDMLTKHFASSSQIEAFDLRQLVWQEGERTGILIESITRWRGDIVGKRPAVVIKQHGRKNVRLGIGDSAGTTEQGQRQYQTFWLGGHTLFCIHGSGASAEILATEVQRELNQWHPVITTHLGLYRWQVSEVGEIAELEEAKESFVVPVTVGWVYSEKWQIDQESLKLRKTPLDILLDGALVQTVRS